MVYIVIISLVAALALLYYYAPRKRYFFAFLAALLLIACGTFFFAKTPEAPPLSREERQALLAQQHIYADWEADYQRHVDRLDSSWARYHQILEDYKEDNISIQTVYVRLTLLENDSRLVLEDLERLAPPLALDTPAYDLVTVVTERTVAYADAQHRAISLTKAAADPERLPDVRHDEMSRLLQSIMDRESPTALFTANEMAELRRLLTPPPDRREAAGGKDDDAQKE